MDLLKGINVTAAFATEIGMYIAYGMWAYSLGHNGLLRWAYSLAIPVVVAVVWGLFAAPQASHRLHGVSLFVLELTLLLLSAALLARTGYKPWAIMLASLSILTQVVSLMLKQ
jgi:hypothetical protein